MPVDKLIKGKWYTSPEWNPGSYAKLEKFEDGDNFRFSEKIYCDAYSVSSDCWTAHKSELQEVSLSEIEKYLPKEWWQSLKKGDCVVSTEPAALITKDYIYCVSNVDEDGWISHICDNTAINGYKYIYYRKATQQETDLYHHLSEPVHIGTKITDGTRKDDFWCIKITKGNLDVVGRFYNKQAKTSVYTDKLQTGSYYASHHLVNGGSILNGNCRANFVLYASSAKYPEITTGEFYKKIGHVPVEEKNHWCVKITEENKEVVKEWYGDLSKCYTIGAHYGVNESGNRGAHFFPYGKVLTTEEFYEKIGHKAEIEEKLEEFLKRWNVGDKITYKSHEECGGAYEYGGDVQDGFVGTINEYRTWESTENCWSIEVSCNNGHDYTMLESEFKEWDSLETENIPVDSKEDSAAIQKTSSTSVLPEPKVTLIKKAKPVMEFAKRPKSIRIK